MSTPSQRPAPAAEKRARRSPARVAATAIAIGSGALLAIAVPLSASAHVTVAPNTAAAGSYSLVTFKVPTESATASTVKLEVDLPTATPFASVSYVPVAGWTTVLTTTTLPKPVKVGVNEMKQAVTKVTWTASPGAEITPGQLQLFPLSLGPVPDTDLIRFSATQTYSDGSVVTWNQPSEDDQHPAPTLFVNEQPPADHHGGAASVTASPEPNSGADAGSGAGAASSGAASSGTSVGGDPLARGLGIGGLVVGAVGVVLAIVWRRRAA